MYSRSSPATPSDRENRSPVVSLLADIREDPTARLVVGVTGIGGMGKKTLLDDIERQYRGAGIAVQRGLDARRSPAGRPRVLIVDDAHDLSDDDVARLQDILVSGETSVVVSYRKWPRSAAFARFVRGVERDRAPLLLGPLTKREVAGRLREATGVAASSELAASITEFTGGMPWLVQRIVDGLRNDGRNIFEQSDVHDTAVEQLALELADFDPALRDVLLALAVGFEPSDHLSAALELDDAVVERLVAQATSDGLLLPCGAPVPLVKQALLRFTPSYRVRGLQHRLVDSLLASGRSIDHVASTLIRDGLHDPRITKALEDAADQALDRRPDEAARLYLESTASSEAPFDTAARRAQAAWALGELDEASQLLDELLGLDDPPDLVRAVRVAAAVWAERGMMERSAEIFRWLGASKAGPAASLGAIAMIATGDLAGAAEMVAAAPASSPTTLGVAVTLMATGIRSSISSDAERALPTLIRASDMMTASQFSVPIPDAPAALAAIVALHRGELDVATAVLEDALNAEIDANAHRPRLLLLRGWAAMQADRLDESRSYLASARSNTAPLTPRDEFVLRAFEIGLARRSDDQLGLTVAWQHARSIILHVPIDLFSLLPLGELMIAGSRLHESNRLAGHVTDAWALLSKLGDPPLWSICLHWSAVQAAILAERPSDLAPHAAALVRFASASPLAAVLASAGKAWVQVLAGDVRTSSVENAARSLAAAGFPWDGARLAGHAAARVEERKDMTRLLACARDLRAVGSSAAHGETTDADPLPGPAHAVARLRSESTPRDSGLSAREREVARLVLTGKTYKEIGETIFISARTAEHHIARIRRQLGATTRSDLLAQLRIVLGPDDPTETVRESP